MQPDPTETTNTPPRRDAAGWALSAVTLAVLVIGVFIIRGVTEQDTDPAATGTLSPPAGEGLGQTDRIEQPNPLEQPIVVRPIATEPTPLPPTGPSAASEPAGPQAPPTDNRLGARTGALR